MKASIKFREEQKPIIRAKIPLSILGFPFQSGVVAGESKDLSLNLSTFFDTGPSFKFSYRPNDSSNPFAISFKSGIGHFGSPISSAVTMSADFSLIGNQNPRFFLHFKPQLGDFGLKKSQSSVFVARPKSSSITNGVVSVQGEDKAVEFVEVPKSVVINNADYFSEKFTVLPTKLPNPGVVKEYLSGMEVSARTALPIGKLGVVSFSWGVRMPKEEGASLMMLNNNSNGWISLKKVPFLVMNKIGIEHVAEEVSRKERRGDDGGVGSGEMGEVCLDVKRRLEVIQAENGKLRNAMEDLRAEMKQHLNGKNKLWDMRGGGGGGEGGLGGGNEEESSKALRGT